MIEFTQVSKTFKRQLVLNELSLRIDGGERVALVGSNGAGKTTLIRCLLGEYVYQGKVSIDGLDPRQNRGRLLTRVGFVPQLPPPLKMTVGQLIRFAASLTHHDAGQIEAIASRLGLDIAACRHQSFVRMSGGQKQKLLIAVALGRDSDILVLDEPAANLDPEARHIFLDLLAARREEATMLISSHRLDEVASLVNRVIELDQGRVVLDDRVADTVSLSSILSCHLTLTRADAAVAKSLGKWRFCDMGDGITWQGEIPGPERLRFLGMLSRYAALLASISMQEKDVDEQTVEEPGDTHGPAAVSSGGGA